MSAVLVHPIGLILSLVATYSWNDLSPANGCHLVRFVVEASSLRAVCKAVVDVPNVRSNTVKKLLKDGNLLPASEEEAAVAEAHPGRVSWRDNDGDWHQE